MEQTKEKTGRRGGRGLKPVLHFRILELNNENPNITAPEIQNIIKREFDTKISLTTINSHRNNPGAYAHLYQKKEESVCNNTAQTDTPLSAEEIAKAVKLYTELKKLGITLL